MDAYSLAFTASLLLGRWRIAMGDDARCLPATAFLRSRPGMRHGLGWTDAVGARALQGIGAAFITTGGFALIASIYVQARAAGRMRSPCSVSCPALRWRSARRRDLSHRGSAGAGFSSSNLPASWGVPRLVAEAREACPGRSTSWGLHRSPWRCRGTAAWPHIDVAYGGGLALRWCSGRIRPAAAPREIRILDPGHIVQRP